MYVNADDAWPPNDMHCHCFILQLTDTALWSAVQLIILRPDSWQQYCSKCCDLCCTHKTRDSQAIVDFVHRLLGKVDSISWECSSKMIIHLRRRNVSRHFMLKYWTFSALMLLVRQWDGHPASNFGKYGLLNRNWTRNALDCDTLITPRAFCSPIFLLYLTKHDVDRMIHCTVSPFKNLEFGPTGSSAI